MRLTKLEHAALILEDSGKKLFVDPGDLSALDDPKTIEAIRRTGPAATAG